MKERRKALDKRRNPQSSAGWGNDGRDWGEDNQGWGSNAPGGDAGGWDVAGSGNAGGWAADYARPDLGAAPHDGLFAIPGQRNEPSSPQQPDEFTAAKPTY